MDDLHRMSRVSRALLVGQEVVLEAGDKGGRALGDFLDVPVDGVPFHDRDYLVVGLPAVNHPQSADGGDSHDEIAAELRTSHAAVRKRYSRALKKMHELLGENDL